MEIIILGGTYNHPVYGSKTISKKTYKTQRGADLNIKKLMHDDRVYSVYFESYEDGMMKSIGMWHRNTLNESWEYTQYK